ncbi:MAG: UDP-N-acetylmuramoyl-L-alanine--D-glutamate ligase [Coriobacteriia bacterium]|nr:UDP-N-acetylmuramoyl-L-alanine--D-glutamate ligase [Coriobacteriia bacterium]
MKNEFIEGKNYAPTNLGQVCVLGLGKTGEVAANYFCQMLGNRVESVHVYAGEKKEFAMRAADKLLEAGATVSFDDDEVNTHYELCICSPGISVQSDLYVTAKKNCDEVISEIEFAWRESNNTAKWVAITGTNGKTTTTSLLSDMLKHAGKHVACVGNIGNVALEAVAGDFRKSIYNRTHIYVVEVSSYQLELTKMFAPDIAILLNITPDHIDWHGSFKAYSDAKLKIFEKAKTAVVNVDDPTTKSAIPHIKSKVKDLIENKRDRENIIVEYGGEKHVILPIEEMKLVGEHNCVNARAAASASVVLGLSDRQIAETLKNFKSLEHRLEECGIIAGVKIYNDSKATNVEAVIVAIDSFEEKHAIFLLGGRDKNTDLDKLVKYSNDKLKGVVCYGESADRFFDAFYNYSNKRDEFIVKKAKDMKSAFYMAMEAAYPGDYIVLSPACSSFDEFENFEDRGNVFKSVVNSIK